MMLAQKSLLVAVEPLGPLEQREGVAELSAHMDVRAELR